jgi:hypothetical protein
VNIEIDWDKVVDVEYNIEGEGIYSISIMFNDGEALSYGYFDQKKYLIDCTEIANKRSRL